MSGNKVNFMVSDTLHVTDSSHDTHEHGSLDFIQKTAFGSVRLEQDTGPNQVTVPRGLAVPIEGLTQQQCHSSQILSAACYPALTALVCIPS